MGLRINTNVASLAAQRSLGNTTNTLNDSLRKLSSGERVTRSGDDAAGLAISENLKAQIRGLKQAGRNAGDAISLIQTAEGGLSEISNIIIRLRELSVQAASDTVGQTERGFSDIEFQQLKEELDRIARSSEFNGIKLLDGTSGLLEFQVGVRNDPVLDRLRYDGTFTDATMATLGLSAETVSSKEAAQISLKKLDDALVQVNGVRANLGAIQNRLTSTVNTLGISDENLNAANSRIRDVDVAAETAELARKNILIQAGTSVLSQANQFPSIALKLIG
ncbi:MAG: flagellin [Bdellovibrionales bacterium RIFOXYD12_FULL_39_22]|nr:MAG: flagellin [Bdellovibrionales bacterium RIFOXYB1_FULL_39_21]OFZ44711.1 MAG: flagellin [Bdellovibrionales bacterium RIFOXYC12_FULL_39_17]OFZ49341.1 MAG: flagellin [Bdellovibrionales bacterium RIFOXYC1_FULL_39_130]OFZ77077.1 MAG: flagellin [Bdellovibrionales bacterium RIFOXYD1_FULL_39_84]OFZ95337.1 MAG: flagellin [Bdellovibrionales bacterium RIFOXYD12_FULL_39_22]HLE13046.1 flagellin [Bacteriovoracaceae bacterium]